MRIEFGKVREYAVATGAELPEYNDPTGPIPPTFLSTVVFWDQLTAALHQPEAVDAFAQLNMEPNFRQLLVAEQEYIFHGPLPAVGDVLQTSHRFGSVEIKEGRRAGRMAFVRFAIEFRDETGELRAECLYTTVYTARPAVASA